MAPIILPSNQPPDRSYKGGARISTFRSESPCGAFQPEDWVASTTCCNGCEESKLGMSLLPDGRLLADVIAAEPEHWLGREHVEAFGVDTKLLFKLLDAGQRLPVHAHPHVNWARKHVGTNHGKAEAWYMLTSGQVYLGLKEDVSAERLLELVNTQNIDAMLSNMHVIDVEPHQTVYVPPGMLHAIGEGLLIVELQEPEDLSVLLEWQGFALNGAKDGHLGLGFQKALTAVDRKGRSAEQISKLVTPKDKFGSVIATESREYFELVRVAVTGQERCSRGLAIVIVLEGNLQIAIENGDSSSLKKGNTVVFPHGDGDFVLDGSGEVLIARPPDFQKPK